MSSNMAVTRGLRNSNRKILPKSQYHSDYNELGERCAGANIDFETLGTGQVNPDVSRVEKHHNR